MIIPFGMMGAVWGHAFLGLPLSLFSMFGLVALAGVVVNNAIVLIDYTNLIRERRRKELGLQKNERLPYQEVVQAVVS